MMAAKTPGRARALFLVALAMAVPAGLLVHTQATAYMDSQAAREVVLKVLQSIPTAEPMKPDAGTPATDTQRAALVKAVGAFQDVLREKNYGGAWEYIHAETYGGWTRDAWEASQKESSEFDIADMMDSPFGLMALGKDLELVDVQTEGAEGTAHVVAHMEFPATFAMRREGDQWLIDLTRSDVLAAKVRVSKQIDTLKSGNGGPWPWAIMMGGGSDLSELFGAFVDYGSLPLWDMKREVVGATVAGDKAEVTVVTRGSLHLLLPLQAKAGTWNLALDGGGEVEVLPPGAEAGAPGEGIAIRGEKATQTACQSNMRQLAVAMMMYCQDYDEKYPPADRWSDALMPYVRDDAILKCPADDGPYSYAMNYKLSRLEMGDVAEPAGTILLFETEPSRKNAFDDRTGAMPGASLAAPGRHNGGGNFAYADGHVMFRPNGNVTLEDYRVEKTGEKAGPAVAPGGPPSGGDE